MEFVQGVSASPVLVTFIGAGVGFLAGLVGAGGGTFMVPILILVLDMPIRLAIGTSLLQMIGTAASGAQRHLKQRTADPFLAATIVVGAILGGQLGAHANRMLPAATVYFILGVSVIWVGVQFVFSHIIKRWERAGLKTLEKEVRMIRKDEEKIARFVTDLEHSLLRKRLLEQGIFQVSHLDIKRVFHGHVYLINIPKATFIGLLVGFFAGLLGVGGGFLAIPLMVGILGVPMHVAVGTSLLVILGSALSGVMVYWVDGEVAPVLALLLLVGGVVGAQAGAFASDKLPDITLRRVFGVLMLLVGLKMIFA